jgi:CubicO group peptidase (beta-lactamase class C family)
MLNHWRALILSCGLLCISTVVSSVDAQTPLDPAIFDRDSDQDGLPDHGDLCPTLEYLPGFDLALCGPMDLNPDNDSEPECKARERIVDTLLNNGAFTTHISFAVVQGGEIHFADAFEYLGAGQYRHDPEGIYRLYRIGSTSKSVTAVAAKVLEEQGTLSLGDFVDDDDGSQELVSGQVTLRQLLSHRDAFKLDSSALHLFCYPGDIAEFWLEPDDLVSPHYDSSVYGNLGGGYEYSAFNYSLAGAHLAFRVGESFEKVIQRRVFDAAGMCTATLDATRAVGTVIGDGWGVSETSPMHVGPYINQESQTDPLCEDNFYSSDDLPGDPYTWQLYHLDEAGAVARDPAGGVIASVLDLAHFAARLLDSYHGRPDGLLSPVGVRDLWGATSDLGCHPNCPFQRYYAIGFFTNSLVGQPVTEVEHGGVRAGYTSAFVLRPENDSAISILINANVSSVMLSSLAKLILDDFEVGKTR